MSEEKKSSKLEAHSRLWGALLTVFAALLTFAGPTYMVLVLIDALKINYAASMVTGFILFIAGLALIWYLIKKKIIS